MWGCLPLYFRYLDHISPVEMLAHRIVWSVPTGLFFVAIAVKWRELKQALTRQNLLWLSISGVLMGGNWLIYIWAVDQERVLEASLGYYINPLANVLIGAVFFSERLRPAQWLAVAIAAAGVVAMTSALGYLPWVALALCTSFAIYGVIRKQVQVDARAGLVVEAAILTPLAFLWLAWALPQPGVSLFGNGGWDIPVLLLAGPLTAIPLILFAIAAKRLRLSTLGMMQYGGPTLQFLISVWIFKEPFGWVHAAAFALIWTALIIFTTDSLIGDAKARRLARTAATIR